MKKIIKNILGKDLSDRFVLWLSGHGFYNHSLKSYAQEGEDIILNSIFKNVQKGFYVDVGAHHPMKYSNTYFFYKKGWNGINIDAMPGSMKLFNKIRKRDINLEMGVAKEEGVLDYYMFKEPALNGFLSSEEAKSKKSDILRCKKIFVLPLSKILDKHLKKGKKIDFLSVDVEGLDLDVLKSNNWEKYKPEVILVEIRSNDYSELTNDEVHKFLQNKNYSLIAKTRLNAIYKIK